MTEYVNEHGNEEVLERYELSIGRIRECLDEETVAEPYRAFFQKTARFLLMIDSVHGRLRQGGELSLEECQRENELLYQDILPGNYECSYANPDYAAEKIGEEYGAVLSFLYTELRGAIAYVYEEKLSYLAVLNELFIEIYNLFEEEQTPDIKQIKDTLYWYASDYCDVFFADRIKEQLGITDSFAVKIVEESDLGDLRYLYKYGEYISQNEMLGARYLLSLDEETVKKMADVYTEGYRMGFVNGNKPLEKKKIVEVRFPIGFERVVKIAMENFAAMGLKTVALRPGMSVLTKKGTHKIGYTGGVPNKQYDYDHKEDAALFLDKRFIERKLEVQKTVYEQNKKIAETYAGPAVMETFGEHPFSPKSCVHALRYNKKQKELSVMYDGRAGQMVNHYIKGEERNFTIISYPVPEIGKDYKEIFGEVIKINTLDAKKYERIQQKLIDVLDQGEYVHILGKGENRTDLKVQLYKPKDPKKETVFENCVADVNIPVGEVFTSPVLEGTNGTLFVSKVYLNELQYKNLELQFLDGKITKYNCTNFDSEEENKKYIEDNILYNHKTLPLGEFAIGTNTTAYVTAKKYGIEDKLTILIAEKMGPHFAVGDTCYSWSEENRVYNPDGKEIVAKDNSISILRKEDVSKAYFQCHTDITIPYEEIASIEVVKRDGSREMLLKDGRFVLEGTLELNVPLDEFEKGHK